METIYCSEGGVLLRVYNVRYNNSVLSMQFSINSICIRSAKLYICNRTAYLKPEAKRLHENYSSSNITDLKDKEYYNHAKC